MSVNIADMDLFVSAVGKFADNLYNTYYQVDDDCELRPYEVKGYEMYRLVSAFNTDVLDNMDITLEEFEEVRKKCQQLSSENDDIQTRSGELSGEINDLKDTVLQLHEANNELRSESEKHQIKIQELEATINVLKPITNRRLRVRRLN